MKKLVAILLALALCLFGGCTSENQPEEEVKKEKKETASELIGSSPEKDSEETADPEEEKEKENTEDTGRIMIDEDWLSLMGKTSAEIADIKGAMSENLWADGPLYRFGPENVWYAFENYDFAEDNSYIPLGICNSISVPLYMLLEDCDHCDAAALENAAGKVLAEEYDIMYECNTYSITYNGCRFVIYDTSRTNISAESVVNIERE